MAKLSSFGTDKNKEVDGVWVDYENGLRFKIARMGNPKVQAYVDKLTRSLRTQISSGRLPAAKAVEIEKKAMARFVLVGWENLVDDDGKEIVYSEVKAFEILRDFPQIYEDVRSYANDHELFREEQLAADEERLGND